MKEHLRGHPVKLAIVYYSSTGTITEIARELHDEGVKAGAEVRPCEGRRTRSAGRRRFKSRLGGQPRGHRPGSRGATPEDVEWADAVIFGTPTRFGNVSSQLKQFIDTLGGLWAEGKLADKVTAASSPAPRPTPGRSRLSLPSTTRFTTRWAHRHPGFTEPNKFIDGNPYGTSHVDAQGTNPVDDVTRIAAAPGPARHQDGRRHQGCRLTTRTSCRCRTSGSRLVRHLQGSFRTRSPVVPPRFHPRERKEFMRSSWSN